MPFEKYYLSEDAYAYPSSNANDGGDDNTEYNLKTITDKFAIKSFVVRRKGQYQNYFILSYSSSPVGVKVSGGECSINGYYFSLGDIVVETTKDSHTVLSPLTKYNIVVRIYKDGNGNLRGDGTAVIGPNSGKLECRGVVVSLMTNDEYENTDQDSLLSLGYVMTDKKGNLPEDSSQYILDLDRFSFIDSSTILTEDGQKLEDWIKAVLNFRLTHLSQLNYYSNESDETPQSTLKITSDNKLIYQTNDEPPSISFDLVDIDSRTHVAEKDNYTPAKFTDRASTNNSDTWNGESDLLCRSDHNHDRRYILRTCEDTAATQIVETNLSVSKELSAAQVSVKNSSGNAVTEFNNDGSATVGSVNISSSGDISGVGDLSASGDISANRVFNAVWNDYAELYLKRDSGYNFDEPGTVICKTPEKLTYEPSSKSNCRLVVGVISDTYGMLLGGKSTNTKAENLNEYYPVAMSGRVKVKVKSGIKIKEGDFLCASSEGRATVKKLFKRGCIIGKSLESSDGSKDKVLIQVMLK